MFNRFKFLLLIALVSIYTTSTVAYQTWAAEPQPNATPTLGPEDYGRVCGNILATAPAAGAPPDQKRQYCAAAKSAYEAAKGQDNLWKAWAAVAGVCVTACAASYMAAIGTAGSWVCNGSAVGAAVYDYTVTKDLMSSLTVIGGMAMGGMMAQKPAVADDAANKAANTAEKKGPSKDMAPCIVAATAAYSAYSKHQSMESQKKAVGTNLQSAQSVGGLAPVVQTSAASDATAVVQGAAGTTSAGTMALRTTSSGQDISSNTIGGTSSGCGASGISGMAILQCAVASDNTLPRGLTHPEFVSGFKDSTGIPLEDFMTKASNPRQAIMASAGGTLSGEQASHLSGALEKMEQGMNIPNPGSAYASGGGGGGGGSGSADDAAMANMMAGLMAQFGPKGEGGEDPQRGLKLVIFANQKRQPAAIAEDPTLSLFDRITFRYHYVATNIARMNAEEGVR